MRRAAIALSTCLALSALAAPTPSPAPVPAPAPTRAPDALEAALQYYKLIYENDAVRVFEHKLPAGHREPTHAAGCRVHYAMSDQALRNHLPDGGKQDARRGFRNAWWRPAETVSLENMASRDLFELVVEFKRPLPGMDGCERAAAATDPAAWATPTTLAWTTDPGTKVAVAPLIGAKDAAGPFVERQRRPAGHRAAPHRHDARLEGTVLSGELRLRIAGDPREVVLPAGSFFTVPPGLTHEDWTVDGVELELRGVGPLKTALVK